MSKILMILIFLSTIPGCWFTKDQVKDGVTHAVDQLYPGQKPEVKPEPVIPVTPEAVKVDPEVDLIKTFQWVQTGDGAETGWVEHGSIVKTYTGNITNPFEVLANVPRDFDLTMGVGGIAITIPKSDPTGNMTLTSGDRTAFLCLFDANKQLLQTEDFANSTTFDNRWKDKAVAYAIVFHCIGSSVVSRSNVVKAALSRGTILNPGNFQEVQE